ncbi:MAG: sigma-54 dependent transcriptional regulator [Phycisphaera sp.]|nr:MAG: sigma-54 dependent transcriptional regulator [Phycisphaera sp.]
MATILLVEDDQDLRYSIKATLERAGHVALEAGSVPEGLEVFGQRHVDLVLTDLRLPGDDGLVLIKAVRGEGFAGGVLVMTSDDSVSMAVEAMKLGADEYLLKPISVAELTLVVERTLERGKRDAKLRLHERLASQRAGEDSEQPAGEHPAWREALAMARRLAGLPLPKNGSGPQALPTVLLTGETGTGKGVLARELHMAAPRDAGEPPFVHVNCAALPANLIESELFGHERGAFTDAKAAREGLFEMASGGTIFLDEIGELPLELQSKLLLVLEAGTLRRVGGTRERQISARVVAATNQNLPERVREKEFRGDLFYRLNTFTIEIPPLRERGKDSLLIAHAALQRFGKHFGRGDMDLSDAAEQAVLGHSWPGNVRELVNVMQRAAMLSKGTTVEPADLPISRQDAYSFGESGLEFDFEHGPCTVEAVERALVEQALRHTGGNVTAAARLIDMQRSSIRNRIDRYGLHEFVKELSA